MLNLLEFIKRCSRYPLRGRVGYYQLRELPLKLNQSIEQAIIVGVWNFGAILDKIRAVVAGNLLTQCLNFLEHSFRNQSTVVGVFGRHSRCL